VNRRPTGCARLFSSGVGRARSRLGRVRAGSGLVLACAVGYGCRDLEDFDTGDNGAYCGNIIDSDFTRHGFPAGLGLRLTLDIGALDNPGERPPGMLSTNDAGAGECSPELSNAPLRLTRELFADSLSLLEFGSNRDHNFVAWVDSQCNGSAMAVVSLMHTGEVEVRLLRRADPADASASDDFGVFQLQRTDCVF
jgi:hypothetical protein